jgi:hypothetical protein
MVRNRHRADLRPPTDGELPASPRSLLLGKIRLLKVSGANELGEPNGEPTSTGIRPRQATSSHSRGWQMPHRATSSHVQRR